MTVLTSTPISLPVNSMLSGAVWSTDTGSPVTVSYDFLQQVPSAISAVPDGDPAENVGWAPLTASEQSQAVKAMVTISAVANISFVSSTDESTANILIGTDNQSGATSSAYTSYASVANVLPGGGGFTMIQDHIEIENNQIISDLPNIITGLVLHELANATGLEDFVVDKAIPDAVNDLAYSVQSYPQFPKDNYTSSSPAGGEPVTPQILDILAWQYLYGANQNGYIPSVSGVTESHIGDDHTYHFTDNTAPMTVWIGANVSGVNAFDFSATHYGGTIDLTPGTMSGNAWADQFGNIMPVLQNVGLAYGTTIQVGIAGVGATTLYADATSGHNDLLIGSGGNDTFVAGDGYDVFVSSGGAKSGGDVVQFHDPYADYKIVAGANGGTLVIDEAAHPLDGTVALSGGFTEMDFGDGKTVVLFPSGSSAASAFTAVETAATISTDLDIYQAAVAGGDYVHQIVLTDSGVPNIQISAAQSLQDEQALALITSPYALSIEMPATGANAQGPGNGIATTVVLSGPASQYSIVASTDGGITLIDSGQVDHLSNVTALQFSDHTVFVASTTPSVAGGVSSAQITTLYAGTLGRLPDAAGLAFYENQAAKSSNASIVTYAEYFLSSPEYAGNSAHAYAQTSAGDAQFVADVYSDLLHRAPEAGAVAWYQMNVLAPMLQNEASGTAAYKQAELLAHATVLSYFSQSPEFLGDVMVTASHPVDAQHWLVLG